MGLVRLWAVLFLLTLFSCHQPTELKISSRSLSSGTNNLLQAIAIVDAKTTWISGHRASFCRTIDGGKSWEVFQHTSDTLQFRDIHAFDENRIVLMSAGPGSSSRIFLFDYQSKKYDEVYVMPHKAGFLNTIEFWDEYNGLAFGDSFNGQLFILKTIDGGQSWKRIDPNSLPKAGEGEGGFAASGTCISTLVGGIAYIGTGAGGNSRILKTTDYGQSWSSADSPLIKGDAAGIFSIRHSNGVGLIAGGDLGKPDEYTQNVAITKDGGVNWSLTNHPLTKGTFYGSDIISLNDQHFIIASGPNGIDYSLDQGNQWVTLDSASYWAVDMHESGVGYASGTEGKILRIEIK